MKAFNLENVVRPNIKNLKPYSSARDEFQGNAHVYLDANENPYPSSYNRYPDPHQKELKKAIAQLKDVTSEQLFLGNGSDEAIDLLIRAFCNPGVDNIIIPQPTYGMYSVSAETNAVEVRTCSLTREFDIDESQILDLADNNSKLLFLCSPNNPTGNLLSIQKIENLTKSFSGIVIVDEAYIDFSESKGMTPYLNKQCNLVILQTFSKAWGLAGIRLGICLGSPEIISILDKIKPPYNINSITQSIALEALKDPSKTRAWITEIVTQRDLMKARLSSLEKVLKIYPSDSNFLLVKMENAALTYQELMNMGIIVRDRSKVQLCENCLRITIGTKEENEQLINALQ